MKLTRLVLHGFKSFPDRTQLHFHEGVTAIVGPNGSGKSNISDAIRWVLGEQKASAIRSAKMEEAIFQGTTERRRVNRAEVAMIFSNAERRLALPYDEVEIRRTVFREGGSEYELNRQAVRLKDILDVCRDTGLGTNVYTVIEQRMVDAILSDRADERRQLFEEASGIGRYKDRRKVAQRRLESADGDLARLDDLIGEVQSKVRSLARQKGKAQRHRELRARRLALEVALANLELERTRRELADMRERLEGLTADRPGDDAALAAAEAELERLRLEAAELARERGSAAGRLEGLNRRIAERERELAVEEERRSNAERRLAQIAPEREELERRQSSLRESLTELEAEREASARELESVVAGVREAHELQQRLRGELVEARQEEELARERDDELSGDLARLRAAAAEADAMAVDAERRLARLTEERAQLDVELASLGEQGDLFDQKSRELSSTIERLAGERDGLRNQLLALREREAALRREEAEAEAEAHRLASRAAALEVEEREFHGFAAPVAAALSARDRLPGLDGALAEQLELSGSRAASAEAAMGSLLQALVARDDEAIAEVRRWLEENGGEDGVLALLPRDAVPQAERLLEAMQFAGRPAGEPFLLGRRERLRALRDDASAAAVRRDEVGRSRQEVSVGLAATEKKAAALEEELRGIEHELRRAESDETARTGLYGRTERHRADLAEREEATRAALEEARRSASTARAEAEEVKTQLDAEGNGRGELARRRAERESAWETARDREAELRVGQARAEGAAAAAERRLGDTRAAIAEADRRLRALAREYEELRTAVGAADTLRTDVGGVLEALFGERDAASAALAALEGRLAASGEGAEELERRVRLLRRDAGERAEERHRLELRAAELEAAERAVRDRLSAEWGRPFEALCREVETEVEGGEETLRSELAGVTADLERLGPINMLAVEEHEEESSRLEFLTSQRQDLITARDDLLTAIRRINRTAREQFEATFQQVRANFHRTFDALFEGGECDIWLADPDDPLEAPIEISASPRGKRTQRINLLSGGERALTSLALLFAIYLVKPSPFCVLDEVDAPLDDANIGRFVSMLEQFKAETQFIVITHNPRTMEAADYIYGVTMEEPGVSKIVGVQLEEAVTSAAAS